MPLIPNTNPGSSKLLWQRRTKSWIAATVGTVANACGQATWAGPRVQNYAVTDLVRTPTERGAKLAPDLRPKTAIITFPVVMSIA